MTRQEVLRAVRPAVLRDAFGRLGTGVAVVTTFDEHREPYGATVTAFAALSVDPPLVQVTLRRTSKATRVLQSSPFAVNVLGMHQADAALHFAGRPSASAPAWAPHGGVPVLTGNAATLECRSWNMYDGGDHVIVVGEIVAVAVGAAEPLMAQGSGLRRPGDPVRAGGGATGAAEPANAVLWDGVGGGWFAGVGSFAPF
jgi:flavin reductase (DIM6/NTAB) family NADH-FMN oxidoreductase RutF